MSIGNRPTPRPVVKIPKCPCCGWRSRQLVSATDAPSFYAEWCADCAGAVESLRRREAMPPLYFGSQPAGERR